MLSAKVTAATAAAALTTILCWILTFWQIDVPDPVQGAITTVLVAAAGYFVPDRVALSPARHSQDTVP